MTRPISNKELKCVHCGESDINKLCKDKRKIDGVIRLCRTCHYIVYEKPYRIENKVRRDLKRHKNNLKKVFDMSIEQYNILLEEQNNRCAICNKHISELPQRLSVDHDHTTGRIRGLLCKPCNLAIGNVFDDCKIAENMVKYLRGSYG